MPLMPADVANVAFGQPPLGTRGYDEDEVDAFLDLVAAELARLIQENTDLRNRVEPLSEQHLVALVDTGGNGRPLEPLGLVVAPVPPPLRDQASPGGDHTVHAARVLGLAQEMADRLTAEAKAEADAMVRHARTKAEQLLCEAKAKADGMVNEARTRSGTMLNDARAKAEALERQSRDKAASLERDAAATHTEIITALSQEKDILEKKIDELHTFEWGYRTRLTTYLDSQLRELGGYGSTEPVDPVHPQQGLVGSTSGAHAEAGAR
jgi:DivIVA domain-containing protein